MMHEGDGLSYPEFGSKLRLYSSTGAKYFDIYHDGSSPVLKSNATEHLILNTTSADKNIRLNSQTFTTDVAITGVQIKPRAGVALTNGLQGCEISPGFNDTFGGTEILGLNVDPILKGSTGNLSGDYRVLNLEIVADDGGNRDIGGDVTAVRVRMCFSAGTITGITSVMRIDTPETQTRSKNYDCVMHFPTVNSGKWAKHAGSGRAFSTVIGSGGDQAAYIRVRINDTYYKIPCMNEA